MIRLASIMYLNEGMEEEYKKRHDQLWPEMEKTLKAYGANNYSIFLETKTNQLFAYLEVLDTEKYNDISQTEICQKWWVFMEPLMKVNSDNSPVSVDLKEVFHLD